MLEASWVKGHHPGDGVFYIISGFANYNGGARFYRTFKEHTENGGKIIAYLGGSTAQKLTSRQAVDALLDCGAEVNIVNRKRLLHAKCYGADTSTGQSLIVTSGNFTGPGMSQNVEASVLLGSDLLKTSTFSWKQLIASLSTQAWLSYRLTHDNFRDPGWGLLYDESPGIMLLDDSDRITLVVLLGHSDTARIQAMPGSRAGLGSQYFWLSKDCFDFFPPLTIRNERGYKGTLSATITLRYCDLDVMDAACRVTFEAENNLDFRLGTGHLRYSKLAKPGDLACITRMGESQYELRIIPIESPNYTPLERYTVNFIGHQGKRYGYLDNAAFEQIASVKLGERI
jgi:hypothetical protein